MKLLKWFRKPDPPEYNYLDIDLDALRRDSARHCRVSREYKYLCTSMPKVGCTTVRRTLHYLNGYRLAPLTKLNEVHDAPQDMHLGAFSDQELKEILASDEWYKFGFVRNPYARTASAWKSKIANSEDSAYLNIRSLIVAETGNRTISFRDFVMFIGKCEEPFIKYDQHWIDQLSILSYNIIPYHKICRFETFNEDFQEILAKIGAPENVRQIGFTKTNSYGVSKLNQIYDEELAEIVYSLNEKTFELFGYDKDSWRM